LGRREEKRLSVVEKRGATKSTETINMVTKKKEKNAYLIPCIRAIRMEEDRAAALVLIHQTGVLEMTNQS
jgi:hypothetical protein